MQLLLLVLLLVLLLLLVFVLLRLVFAGSSSRSSRPRWSSSSCSRSTTVRLVRVDMCVKLADNKVMAAVLQVQEAHYGPVVLLVQIVNVCTSPEVTEVLIPEGVLKRNGRSRNGVDGSI
ncbi:hypothetical protein B484DRAFT_428240 [Ochromonadaceae sp. CCMP2298]|nr:hypothetical protein B484DRAFT_428240 [Ochromonadaceae sp. CCMP2298]